MGRITERLISIQYNEEMRDMSVFFLTSALYSKIQHDMALMLYIIYEIKSK